MEEYEFKIHEKYNKQNYKLIKTLKAEDKIINLYNNNKKEILFPSGVRKEIFEDGHQIIHFVNGDIKQNYPSGKVYIILVKLKQYKRLLKMVYLLSNLKITKLKDIIQMEKNKYYFLMGQKKLFLKMKMNKVYMMKKIQLLIINKINIVIFYNNIY